MSRKAEYRRYTRRELAALPVGTVLEAESVFTDTPGTLWMRTETHYGNSWAGTRSGAIASHDLVADVHLRLMWQPQERRPD